VAHWDFAAEIGREGVPSDTYTDRGPHGLHARDHNAPYRAMTGWNWTGEEENYRHAPEQYGAVHFTDDALEDAGWETDVRFTVPDDLPSAVYALRISLGDTVDHIPFWVLPPRGARRPRRSCCSSRPRATWPTPTTTSFPTSGWSSRSSVTPRSSPRRT
jgi:N,N-dimethylformamidase